LTVCWLACRSASVAARSAAIAEATAWVASCGEAVAPPAGNTALAAVLDTYNLTAG